MRNGISFRREEWGGCADKRFLSQNRFSRRYGPSSLSPPALFACDRSKNGGAGPAGQEIQILHGCGGCVRVVRGAIRAAAETRGLSGRRPGKALAIPVSKSKWSPVSKQSKRIIVLLLLVIDIVTAIVVVVVVVVVDVVIVVLVLVIVVVVIIIIDGVVVIVGVFLCVDVPAIELVGILVLRIVLVVVVGLFLLCVVILELLIILNVIRIIIVGATGAGNQRGRRHRCVGPRSGPNSKRSPQRSGETCGWT
jgi:hypothetical protein